MMLITSLLNRIKEVQGWFSAFEADLLFNAALAACVEYPDCRALVEIGSYQGKSTVVLGSLVKHYFPRSKVYAIDPHQGKFGAVGHDLQTGTPSLMMFKQNIEKFGLADYVVLLHDYSFNVHWSQPISFLFIDGLHDYENVSRDFCHFSRFLVVGAYVAFHDYVPHYPAVIRFVEELASSGNFKRIGQAQSLVVLQYVGDLER